MKTIEQKISEQNSLHGYERYAIPGNGWRKDRILVMSRAGVVETTISRAKFLAIK